MLVEPTFDRFFQGPILKIIDRNPTRSGGLSIDIRGLHYFAREECCNENRYNCGKGRFAQIRSDQTVCGTLMAENRSVALNFDGSSLFNQIVHI
jgi:hypothetical protein